MTLSPGTRVGPYEISNEIGAGGMGVVYRATDTKLDREVAIKTLPSTLAADTDRLARFEREAKLLAALNHPNIAIIYGLEEQEGTQCIAMELIEGETLEEKLKDGPLPVEDALRLALQIAQALEAAHEKGVIHRDLKPANVMVTTKGLVKVLDFGLAKAFSEDPDASLGHSPALSLAMTQQGMVLGTASYMSPEQASGQATDQRADIWAFGVVLFEMLSGLPLFTGESVPHILADVLKSEPDWNRLPKNLHPRLKLLLERCLKKKANSRYHAIADARIDIEEVLGDPAGLQANSDAHEITSARPVLRWVAASVVLTAAIAGVLGWSLWPAPEPRPVNRFDYYVPEGLSFANSTRSLMDLSPDGRHFVYATADGLYLRTMGVLQARLIAGTEDIRVLPFFSPDGQSVAYFAFDGQMKRISINGGAAVPITETGAPSGASWGPGERILWGQADGIYSVSATGGTAVLIIPGEEGGRLYGPELLPDGDSVLFTIERDASWDEAQIVVESLLTEERTMLIRGGSDAHYLPTGHLVYAFGDGLFAVAFDPDNLTLAGGAVPLVQGVMRATGTGAANYAISNDGTLVYVTGGAAGLRSLVWVDREGREEAIPTEPSRYLYPRISPDGGRVALDDRSEENILWVWDFVSETRTRLTIGENSGGYPAWSPDGTRIAYGPRIGEIDWKAANNTGRPERLATGLWSNDIPDPYFFSPSGDELVFRGQASPGNGNDVGMITIGSDAEPVWLLQEQYHERNAELSPDGRWMAYQSFESGDWEIYVRPFPNVDDDQVQVSNANGFMPLWSRDGRELFYLEPGSPQRLMSVTVDATETVFSFSTRTPILDWPYQGAGGGNGRKYDVSADGQQFLAIKEGGAEGARPRIVVVQNWFEELNRLVPTE